MGSVATTLTIIGFGYPVVIWLLTRKAFSHALVIIKGLEHIWVMAGIVVMQKTVFTTFLAAPGTIRVKFHTLNI